MKRIVLILAVVVGFVSLIFADMAFARGRGGGNRSMIRQSRGGGGQQYRTGLRYSRNNGGARHIGPRIQGPHTHREVCPTREQQPMQHPQPQVRQHERQYAERGYQEHARRHEGFRGREDGYGGNSMGYGGYENFMSYLPTPQPETNYNGYAPAAPQQYYTTPAAPAPAPEPYYESQPGPRVEERVVVKERVIIREVPVKERPRKRAVAKAPAKKECSDSCPKIVINNNIVTGNNSGIAQGPTSPKTVEKTPSTTKTADQIADGVMRAVYRPKSQ